MNFSLDFINEKLTFHQLAELKRLAEDEADAIKKMTGGKTADSIPSPGKYDGISSDDLFSALAGFEV